MDAYRKRSIPPHFAVLCGANPPDEDCFQTEHLQVICNSSDDPWRDPGMHMHQASDEVYIVLDGVIDLAIGDELISILPGEVCTVRANVMHGVIRVETPYRGFVIRAPSVEDKVSRGE